MLHERYWGAVEELLKKIREKEECNIVKAGQIVADCVASGGNVYLHKIVHGIEYDLIYRGGGPIFYKPFSYSLSIDNTGRKRDGFSVKEGAAAAYALDNSDIREGDVLFVSSVSGRTRPVVELAYEAEKRGIKVIALTSMEYAKTVDAVHSTGKKLYEMVTLTIDNCAPSAEAMLDVSGIEAKFAAASGIASDYILWSLTAVAVEELLKKGVTPGILKSANFPGGNDYNKTVVEPTYEKTGH